MAAPSPPATEGVEDQLGGKARTKPLRPAPASSPRWVDYLEALVWVTAATAVSWSLLQLVDLANIVMVYLLAVVLVAARLGKGPSIVATVLGVSSFVYFFVPHFFFALSDLRYLPTFTIMLVVGLMVSTLTSRLRAEAVETHEREIRSQALYQLSRGLAAAETREVIAAVVRERVLSVFGCSCWLLESDGEQLAAIPQTSDGVPFSAEGTAMAKRSLRERSSVGGDEWLFLPMIVANEAIGLLCCHGVDVGHLRSTANLRFLEAFANNAAIACHRLIVGDEARATQQRIDKERLRNVMLSSMSHDFRTPLASITGAITTLIDSGERIDKATQRDLMQSIREDADFLERQIRNMLDLTKLESGNLQIHREWHPMEEVVGCAMTRVDSILVGRSIAIAIPHQLPLVAIDALLVEQMLVNLLENAARYTPPGSALDLTVASHDDRLRITVADRGPGIPPGEHERIFTKFYRGNGTRQAGGVGLGLAICRAIAMLHDGRIWVEDRFGGGAVFQIDLPIGGEQPEPFSGVPVPGPELQG